MRSPPPPVLASLAAMSLSLSLLAAACGPDDDNGDDPTDDPTDENTATAAIGPAGGTLSAAGCWISFAPGALLAETDITVTRSEDPVPEGFQAFSPLCVFEPADLVLEEAASVKLGFEGAGDVAALFHASGESARFHRIGGAVDGAWIGASIARLGSFFVGHGSDFEERPDQDCTRTRMVGGRPHPALSSVMLDFAVEDCEGRPISGLETSAFTIKENASEVASAVELSEGSHQVLVTLVLDASSPMQSIMNEVIEAMRFLTTGFIDEGLPVRLAVEIFGGSEDTIVWRPHRQLDDSFDTEISEIVFDLPTERQDPNLHGAVVDALARLATARQEVESATHGGATTSGFLLLFSAQEDGAGIHTLEEAGAAVETARSEEGVRVMGIGLHHSDYDPRSLDALAPDGVSTARASDLKRETSFAAWKIARILEGTYHLAYCSGQISGEHEASVELTDSSSSEPGVFSFDAEGFGSACDATILSSACQERECGGMGCGVCDDRAFECDAETSTCKSFCERSDYCAGDTFTNPAGFEQTCPEDETNTRCGGQCVDITSSEDNCGECRLSCNEGFACVESVCECVEGLTDCDGVCRDTTNDTDHCGDCNLPCAVGGECSESQCSCPGEDGRVCDGICRDVAVDAFNCGGCGILCGDEDLTSCNHGSCGGLRWTTTPMPNPESSGLPNPAGYVSDTDTVTDSVTGLVWQRHAGTSNYTWAQAQEYCRTLDLGDASKWRLPSRIELVTLVDFTSSAPMINQSAFPATPADWSWSSSPRANTTNQAWAVDFASGDSGTIMAELPAGVRCVRN